MNAPARPRRLGQARRERLCWYVFAIGMIASVALWWFNTPGRPLHGAGDQLTALGRITGLLAAYLIIVQLVLIARILPLDRWIGTDRLLAWHRQNGQYTIITAIVHTVLITWGYAAKDAVSIGNETVQLLRSYSGVLAATVSLALFVLVSVTSMRRSMARMRRETWYFIHLYSYLAIWFAFDHEIALGNEFHAHAVPRVVWISAHVSVVGALFVFRVVLPLRDYWRHRLHVMAVIEEGPNVVSVYITGRRIDDLRANSGQFFRWRFITPHGWWKSHPFSLSAAPNGDHLRITVKACGDDTRALRDVKVGTPVLAEGPYGNLTSARRQRNRVALLAGGIGVTPLRAIFESIDAQPGDVALVYRVRASEDLVLKAELDDIAVNRGFDVHYLVGRNGTDPLSAASLSELIPDLKERDVFLCGPPGMMKAVTTTLDALAVPRDHVHTERFEL